MTDAANPFPPTTDTHAVTTVAALQPQHPAGDAAQDGGALRLRVICRTVRRVVGEVLFLFGDRALLRRDRRFFACHVRQVSMYVCHVALGIPQGEVGTGFGRERTTVGHACQLIEDRRDDPVFDDFVTTMEHVAFAVFGRWEGAPHD